MCEYDMFEQGINGICHESRCHAHNFHTHWTQQQQNHARDEHLLHSNRNKAAKERERERENVDDE